MKIRIGFGLGTRSLTNDHERFGPFVDDLERLGYDSIWLSERISGESPDPVVAMSFVAGRTENLKFGTSVMVLPGRNPVLVAKELASLDRLSGGRCLPAFGLGAVNPIEHQAFGVERKERASMFNEALPLIRRLWQEDEVTHHGKHYHFDKVRVLPKPVQETVDVWMGGAAESELKRVGRLSDGWLPSFCDAADVAEGKAIIERAADEADREIDPEHYGVMVFYTDGEIPERTMEIIKRRKPDGDPNAIIPKGVAGVRQTIEQMIEAGASKFVVAPVNEPPGSWTEELEMVAEELLRMQTPKTPK